MKKKIKISELFDLLILLWPLLLLAPNGIMIFTLSYYVIYIPYIICKIKNGFKEKTEEETIKANKKELKIWYYK